jgi:hypothetical protein
VLLHGDERPVNTDCPSHERSLVFQGLIRLAIASVERRDFRVPWISRERSRDNINPNHSKIAHAKHGHIIRA